MNLNVMRVHLLQAMKKSRKKFVIHNCGFCNYPCGFFHNGYNLLYDSGCDCVRSPSEPRICGNDSLDFYLKPEHGHIEKIKAFIQENFEVFGD